MDNGGVKIYPYAIVEKGAEVGEGTKIGSFCFIENGAVIGKNCTIKNGVYIWDRIVIRDNVFVGPCAVFTNVKRPVAGRRGEFVNTWVGDGATIGANATICPGVCIGPGALIAAGAVVTKDVPPGETWAGNPARRIKNAAAEE